MRFPTPLELDSNVAGAALIWIKRPAFDQVWQRRATRNMAAEIGNPGRCEPPRTAGIRNVDPDPFVRRGGEVAKLHRSQTRFIRRCRVVARVRLACPRGA